ncbi:MAG: cohesin domain-containing protein [Patescibacteria group bacterium]|nr:cohesin domain-containing protein [Patescibacteria group bacterium]
MIKNINKCKKSIVSIVVFLLGVVLVLVLGVRISQAVEVKGSSLFLSPGSETFKLGDSFSVEVKIKTGDIPINSAQAVIHFPADTLEVLSISQDDSVFALWPEEPAFSNSDGTISFAGGLPHPGFQQIGNIITINFKGKKQGIVHIAFGEGKILADDGEGTNVLLFLKEAKYFIQQTTVISQSELETAPLQIFSPTHVQQDEWYNNNDPYFQWVLTPDTTGVSFLLDQNSETIPDTKSEGLIQSKTYKGVADGVWYFHLRLENETEWTQSVHYRIQVDNLSPYPFEVTIDNKGDVTNPEPDLYFETDDDVSGISRYELKIGEGDFYNVLLAQINPFSMPFQVPGSHRIIVRAVDRAGNSAQANTLVDIEPIETPVISVWPEKYIAGEEIFYLEGQALPEVKIIISLEKNGQNVKEWYSRSNQLGEWSFSTKELVQSGIYSLSAKVQDERGVFSNDSDVHKIEVSLSGISLGIFTISFKSIILFLSLSLFLGFLFIGYLVYNVGQTKKTLRKETREVRKSVLRGFELLEKEVESQIEMFDSRSGFNKKERKLYDDLREDFKIVQDFIGKEIEDIEKELE